MPANRLKEFARRLPPSKQEEVDRFARNLQQLADEMSPEELEDYDTKMAYAFSGGFTARDEANALIALAVRNGPIEDLHAGKHSALLEDDTLSRITDKEMKILMIHATRMLAGLLRLRESHPDLYRRYILTYGQIYCSRWEREQ